MKTFLSRFWKCIVAGLAVVPAGIATAYQSGDTVTQNEWLSIILGALGVGYAVWQAPRNKLSTKEARETHSDETLYKVRQTLVNSGWETAQADDSINDLLNAGIVFRERSK